MQSLTSLCSHCSPSFIEELKVLKQVKNHIEYHWRKTKGDSNWTCLRVTIKAYFMVVKAAKCNYFSALISSAECYRSCSRSLDPYQPKGVWMIIFRAMQNNLLNTDKITQIHSQLESLHGVRCPEKHLAQ